MNTVTAYAARARAARDAALAIATADQLPTRLDADRAWHLADFAQRCDALANIADGDRMTAAFRNAGDYADQAHAAARTAQDRRHAAYGVERACRENDRKALADALRVARGAHMTEGERTVAARAARRLATLPAGRPAVDALSWAYARHLGMTAEQIERMRGAAAQASAA
ncbi:hypothetical protein GCM10009592_26880 [Brachybacterium rhamnosum]|uniref:Exonuclease SbcC n=1 Tax=Brachybacterium rhamnosum TaxID=173361 RepID=A0ABW4PZJ7_9MICO